MFHINKIENGVEKRHLSFVSETYANAYAVLEAMAEAAVKSAVLENKKWPVLHKWALQIGNTTYRIESESIEGSHAIK